MSDYSAYYQKLGEKASQSKSNCDEAGGYWTGTECYFGGGREASAPLPLYGKYYPEGYSACVADQKCRGNSQAKEACKRLMSGDPSLIKIKAGMAKGAVFMGDCSKTFAKTKLGCEMQGTALTESVIVKAAKGEIYVADRSLGGKAVIDSTPLISRLKMPEMPTFKMPDFGIGAGTKAIGAGIVIFIVAIVALVAIGYSGLGGAGGEIASREHKRKRG
jgi:hypothetical protein